MGNHVKTVLYHDTVIQAMTKEKIYARVGPEFGNRAFSMALITRGLYGLIKSAERFRTLLADFLHSLGFNPSRCDRDVSMMIPLGMLRVVG